MSFEFPAGFQPGDRLITTWERGGTVDPLHPPEPWAPPPLQALPIPDYEPPDLRALGRTTPLFASPPPAGALGMSLFNPRMDAPTMPIHPKSAQWLAAIGPGVKLHPDFGFAGSEFMAGIPYNLATAQTPRRPAVVAQDGWPDESDQSPDGLYPIPDGAVVEKPGDRHLIVVDTSQTPWCAWEFFNFRVENGRYTFQQVTRWPLDGDPRRALGKTSADAAGLCVLAGLVRPDEMFAPGGTAVSPDPIQHALRITLPRALMDHSCVAPATHFAPESTVTASNPNLIPYGTRLRIKASKNIATKANGQPFSPEAKKILAAGKAFGFIVADNGSGLYFQGAPSKRWNDSTVADVKEVTAADLEVIQPPGYPVITTVP